MKIILLSFPKSGSTSFQELFTRLGMNSVHWSFREGNKEEYVGARIYQAKREGRELLYYLKQFDCITQLDVCINESNCYWPQIHLFNDLYNENKECLFILNKRSANKILKSMKHWVGGSGLSLDRRVVKFNKEILEHCSGKSNDEKILDMIRRHYEAVEDYFKNRDGAKFVSYDIEKDDLEKLRKYIDIPALMKFPHANKTCWSIATLPEILRMPSHGHS